MVCVSAAVKPSDALHLESFGVLERSTDSLSSSMLCKERESNPIRPSNPPLGPHLPGTQGPLRRILRQVRTWQLSSPGLVPGEDGGSRETKATFVFDAKTTCDITAIHHKKAFL